MESQKENLENIADANQEVEIFIISIPKLKLKHILFGIVLATGIMDYYSRDSVKARILANEYIEKVETGEMFPEMLWRILSYDILSGSKGRIGQIAEVRLGIFLKEFVNANRLYLPSKHEDSDTHFGSYWLSDIDREIVEDARESGSIDLVPYYLINK